MSTDINFKKTHIPKKAFKLPKDLSSSTFVSNQTKEEIEKDKEIEKAFEEPPIKVVVNPSSYSLLKDFYTQKKNKTKEGNSAFTPTSLNKVSAMYDMDKHKVRLLVFSLLRFTSEFEELWKMSNKIAMDRNMIAFCIESLKEISAQIDKAQETEKWPVLKIEGTTNA